MVTSSEAPASEATFEEIVNDPKNHQHLKGWCVLTSGEEPRDGKIIYVTYIDENRISYNIPRSAPDDVSASGDISAMSLSDLYGGSNYGGNPRIFQPRFRKANPEEHKGLLSR